MAEYQLIIIGGGLSGIAAGIRAARFDIPTLILERHHLPGGLNSYYHRNGMLLETGLHAMTNYAQPEERRAPLNILFRQLKLKRKAFQTREQLGSEIRFPGVSLAFSNELGDLTEAVAETFPSCVDGFRRLLDFVTSFDPFAPGPWRSARTVLQGLLDNRLLEDMLLLPVMVYGNAEERDMDLRQFVIMFRAVFLEGFFRPGETIREFLDLLLEQYRALGGTLRYQAAVERILFEGDRICGVALADGSEIACQTVLSTVGVPETARLSGWQPEEDHAGRMSFIESIMVLPGEAGEALEGDRTILFFNDRDQFTYQRPVGPVDPSWGVICQPERFVGIEEPAQRQIRVTLSANYDYWQSLSTVAYHGAKSVWLARSLELACQHIGPFADRVLFSDCFTPMTIERYSGKACGAIYGSPHKLRDGMTPWPNLFLAGTDQGYLGIVGAMLSGVTMVNRHLLV